MQQNGICLIENGMDSDSSRGEVEIKAGFQLTLTTASSPVIVMAKVA